MRRSGLCSLGLLAMCSGLHADWKITTVTTALGHRSVETEYFRDQLRRVDRNSGNGDRFTEILDLDRLRQVVWSSTSREYVVNRLSRRKRVQDPPGPVIVIDRRTRDTGETRTMLGRTARHLITEEGNPDSGRAIDGWYIEVNGLPREKDARVISYLMDGHRVKGQGPPSLKVTESGPVPSGLAVFQKVTSSQKLPNGAAKKFELTIEVTELFEGSLDNHIFLPPQDYHRVITISGERARDFGDALRLRWEWFQDWLTRTYV